MPRIRRLAPLFFVIWGAASLSGVEVTPDLRKIEPLALVADAPAVAAVKRKVEDAQGRRSPGSSFYLHLRSGEGAFPEKVRALGGRASRVHERLYTGTFPADAARYVSRWPEVAYIEAAKRVRPMLDLSRPAVSADVVHSGTGLPAAYTGDGMYVGIVDSGLSSTHLDFFTDGDPGLSRVAHWYPNQGVAGVDTEWHGTHAAGIIAGNGFLSGGLFTGMAPEARLLVARTNFTTVDIQNAVANILSFAGATPASVNLSLGLVTGPNDGTSGFESGIGSLAANGVAPGRRQIITAAAGNERTDREHFQAVLSPFESVSVSLSLETGGSLVDFWADGADRYTVTATMGSQSASAQSGNSASSSGGEISVFNRTDAPPNGATHITVFFTASATTAGSVRLDRTRNGGSGKVDAYIDQFDGFFTTATAPGVVSEAGTVTEPANARDVIAVGSFVTKTSGGIPGAQNISSFSSLGPTRDGRTKPDLAAPGSLIYSAKSEDTYRGPHPEPRTVPGRPDYIVLQGTSMSAPHVAGIAALVWESNPSLTSAQMRARLRRTATPVPPSPNNTWGFGKANAFAAVSSSVASIAAPLTAVPGAVVTLASGDSSGAFGNPILRAWSFTSRPAGSAATLSSPTAPSPTFTPDVPGEYAVSLTVSQAVPAGTSPGTAQAVIRANNVPAASIAGPSSDNVGLPVTFTGTGSSDGDAGQNLTYRWVLVSRPSGSLASLLPAGSDNATMTPDSPGVYEIGLRVDDGLDNSALATRTFTATGNPAAPAGGGGGCSVVFGTGAAGEGSSLASLLLLLLPLGTLSARKFVRYSSRRVGGGNARGRCRIF